MEETNMTTDGNKNDFTQELGKDSFKDKEEVMRAIKLHCIRTHKQFEIVETRPDIWTIRCKLHLKTGCKWQVRSLKRKRSGCFEITKYTGPHTCLHSNISQDHPNLDGSLIPQEIKHLIKEQPSISVWQLGRVLCCFAKISRRTSSVQSGYYFWAFAPCIKGFKHFRPVISIDGTHLYGKYKGTMMIAIGVDGNNQILPLAFKYYTSVNLGNEQLNYIQEDKLFNYESPCEELLSSLYIPRVLNKESYNLGDWRHAHI
ncbi:hypothetical protein LXL04_025444 [Taraxacum kok-saghyz]